jgi:hypothetical protein
MPRPWDRSETRDDQARKIADLILLDANPPNGSTTRGRRQGLHGGPSSSGRALEISTRNSGKTSPVADAAITVERTQEDLLLERVRPGGILVDLYAQPWELIRTDNSPLSLDHEAFPDNFLTPRHIIVNRFAYYI